MMWKNKKNIFLFFILCFAILLTGCWDREELKEHAIVGAIGLDEEQNETKLTFEIIKAKSAKAPVEEQESAIYLQAKGKSITDVLNQANYKLETRLFMPHCNEYIFSQEVAKKGLLSYLDYFNREHETRRYVDMIITKDKAADIIGVGTGLEKNPSLSHEKLFRNSSENLRSVRVRLLDFFIAYSEDGIEPVAELIQKLNKAYIGGQKAKEEFEVVSEGASVFLEDKLVGFLDGYQTMGYNIMKGDVRAGTITVTYPEDKQISFSIMKGSSEKKVFVNEKNANSQISVKLKVSVSESSYRGDIESIDGSDKLKVKIVKQIKAQLQDTVTRAQELKSDILGLGQVLHRTEPHLWKELKANWNTIFPEMPVSIDVDVEIIRYGVSNEQVGRMKENDGKD